MLARLRSGLNFSNVVSLIALFVALGGGAYALSIPRNSVGTMQLRNSAVTSAKVKDGTLLATDFRPGQIPAGQQGPKGDTGAAGAPGAPGAPFDANATLPSGQTLTGVWGAASATSQNLVAVIQFSPQLPAALADTAVHRLTPGTTSAQCPGPGQAARGQLCVYERATSAATFNVIADPAAGTNGANRRGAEIEYSGAGSGNPFADGSWAVTAP